MPGRLRLTSGPAPGMIIALPQVGQVSSSDVFSTGAIGHGRDARHDGITLPIHLAHPANRNLN